MTKKEIREKWVEMLKSGEYTQGHGSLRTDDKFCCLGVLCELAVKEGVIGLPSLVSDNMYSYGDQGNLKGNRSFLPDIVQEWAGVTTNYGKMNTPELSLVDVNDTGKTFEEIAELIASEPEGLFIQEDTSV